MSFTESFWEGGEHQHCFSCTDTLQSRPRENFSRYAVKLFMWATMNKSWGHSKERRMNFDLSNVHITNISCCMVRVQYIYTCINTPTQRHSFPGASGTMVSHLCGRAGGEGRSSTRVILKVPWISLSPLDSLRCNTESWMIYCMLTSQKCRWFTHDLGVQDFLKTFLMSYNVI